MNNYTFIFTLNEMTCEETISAANRIMAEEIFYDTHKDNWNEIQIVTIERV